MKLNTSKKWFRTLLALSISFTMVIGIFGGMKLEAKAANNITIDVGDPNSMENFKSIIFAFILFFLIKYTNKHPVIYIALSAVVGILLSF